jgi:hypothetical protein
MVRIPNGISLLIFTDLGPEIKLSSWRTQSLKEENKMKDTKKGKQMVAITTATIGLRLKLKMVYQRKVMLPCE